MGAKALTTGHYAPASRLDAGEWETGERTEPPLLLWGPHKLAAGAAPLRWATLSFCPRPVRRKARLVAVSQSLEVVELRALWA